MRLVFCLFADSVGLLPHHTFRELVKEDRHSPIRFNKKLPHLFAAMSEPDGFFGKENIPYFNGGLFSDNAIIELDHADLGILNSASQHDWSHIEPSIFGTLFERSLDAAKRSMIGAHYTSTEDILLLIEPVVMAPLIRRWQQVQQQVLAALGDAQTEAATATLRLTRHRTALDLLQNWEAELTRVRILDPACGSGNFLYVALKRLLDLWHEARIFGIAHGLTIALDPIPHPGQLFGIEIDFYAHEIASIVVWIGFLQWKHDHGVKDEKEPLLQKLTNIEHADAILRYDAEGKAYEPAWPEAEFIVGNPPFLGGNKIRHELGSEYVDDLFALYAGRVGPLSDLVCYWFERARTKISESSGVRAGLLATQGIRGGANRGVLTRIKESGDIFFAQSDRKCALDGAVVRISMVGFDEGAENLRSLDGQDVRVIHLNLSAGTNTTAAVALPENEGLCFMGVSPKGKFDLSSDVAEKMMRAPRNVNGRPNSDVLRKVLSGIDIVGEARAKWTLDFGVAMPEEVAAHYEFPFEYVRKHVFAFRQQNNRQTYCLKWWLFGEPRPAMRAALARLKRYIATPATAKHRVFIWVVSNTLCNQGTLVFAREDDYFFGVLHSSIHELWARAQGTQLREVESGFRYTPNSTFDTFPFPYPPGTEPSEADSPIVRAIADAARELVRLRDLWLNPPDTPESELKKRTLTNLYNERPTWLDNAHRTLDHAVFAAYDWPPDLTTQQILTNLLALNHERASIQVAKPARQPARRKTSKRLETTATTP